MAKKKVLFIVYDFVQAGGQKYAYEVANAIDKEKFQFDFLCMNPLNVNNNRKEYYYEKTLQAGCRVRFFHLEGRTSVVNLLAEKAIDIFPHTITGFLHRFVKKRITEKQFNLLVEICNEYDHINWGGTGIYKHWGRHIQIRAKSYIHVLSTSFQYKGDFYNNWDKNRYYHFITPLSPGLAKKELSGFNNYSHTSFPLIQSGRISPRSVGNKRTDEYKVAVFTRISSMKPVEPYLYALKLLIERGVNVQLLFFGTGSEQTALEQKISHIYLSDSIRFMGHAESIPDALNVNKVDLVWFQSANNDPAGYAAYEVALTETPQVLWDFEFIEKHKQTNDVFPSYTNLTDFVNQSLKILQDSNYGMEIGRKQAQFILEKKSAKQEIKILENLFE